MTRGGGWGYQHLDNSPYNRLLSAKLKKSAVCPESMGLHFIKMAQRNDHDDSNRPRIPTWLLHVWPEIM